MLFDSLPLEHLARPPVQPSPGRPALLVLLHGVASSEKELFRLVPRFDPRFYVLSLRGPQTYSQGSHGWFEMRFTATSPQIHPDHAEESRRKLVEFLEKAPAHYKADPKRVILFGFCQGAILSLAAALTRPELLSGAVIIAGRTMPELFLKDGPLSGHLAPRHAYRGFPIFVGHGLKDDMLPVRFAQETQQVLTKLNFDLTYREYEMRHELGEVCLNDAQFWLSRFVEEEEEPEPRGP